MANSELMSQTENSARTGRGCKMLLYWRGHYLKLKSGVGSSHRSFFSSPSAGLPAAHGEKRPGLERIPLLVLVVGRPYLEEGAR